MTKIVFEEMLEFTTMEDIDSLMRALRQSSIHENGTVCEGTEAHDSTI